jgi:hypothetical protein
MLKSEYSLSLAFSAFLPPPIVPPVGQCQPRHTSIEHLFVIIFKPFIFFSNISSNNAYRFMISSVTGKALCHLLNQNFSIMSIVLELFTLQDEGQVLPPRYPIFMRIGQEDVPQSFAYINCPFLKYPIGSKPVSCRYMNKSMKTYSLVTGLFCNE